MDSSTDQPSTPERSRSLRRLGPLVALAAVAAVAVVIALGVSSGDDDTGQPDPENGPDPTEPVSTDDDPPDPEDGWVPGEFDTGAISFSQAQERGLDVEFPPGCDLDAGRVAIPFSFRGECYADLEPSADYVPPQGVTEDTIRVGVYIMDDRDPLLTFGLAAVLGDDTSAEMRETFQGYADIYNEFHQTYGRTVELVFIDASGFATDETAARADAVRAAEDEGVFAVWGGPLLVARPWAEELQARGIVCICGGLDRPGEAAPQTFAPTASSDQSVAHLAEYVTKKLAGRPAVHAGDPAMHDRERVFGRLYLTTPGSDSAQQAARLEQALAEGGAEIVEHISYELDVARLQEQALTAITRFKSAGVTTVLISGDPLAPITWTNIATQQDFFPEWVLGGSPLMDSTAFGRAYGQDQWANAFGISSLPARVSRALDDPFVLYEWYHGTPPPADDTVFLIYPNPSLFYLGLQAAGPDLTAESFRDGLFSLSIPEEQSVVSPLISFGRRGFWEDSTAIPEEDRGLDYFGIDDFVELWWDPTWDGPSEIGDRSSTGVYRLSDGGRRYLPGDWPETLGVFDPDGTMPLFTERPPGEEVPDYPSPR